jgi:formylglycine-generating enzyme required for sulfatase activity
MKTTITLAIISLTLSCAAVANADTFGSGDTSFDIELVTIGNPGNPADDDSANPNFAGSVPYQYRVGKFEVSRDMINKANAEGLLDITLADMSSRGGNRPNMPATGVSWNEAARFVNWLNISTGNKPAYKFAIQPGEVGYNPNTNIEPWSVGDVGYNPANWFRNSQARYVLPSFNEWYKAAFYDPNTGTYFDYPTGSNAAPMAVAGGTAAGSAVYDHFQQGPADITNAGGLSPYGTMAQAGNVHEWEETTFWRRVDDDPTTIRGARGGYWGTFTFGPEPLSAMNRIYGIPTFDSELYGFRIASIPEPCTIPLLTTAAVASLLGPRRWR